MQVGFADDAAGELVFPVEQTCETGSTSWSEVAEAGQDAHDLEAPAPTLVMATPSAEAVESDDDGPGALEIAGYAASGAALAIALVSLGIAISSRRR
jgi:hypothetical protein